MAKLRNLADLMASRIGSWPFIIFQSLALFAWIVINGFGLVDWDPYPFILLNLLLSFQAAYTGPILLMAASRQAEIDRRRAIKNLNIDLADHEIIIRLQKHIDDHFHQLVTKLEEKDAKFTSVDTQGGEKPRGRLERKGPGVVKG
jgi:uncharacterized membrane protein